MPHCSFTHSSGLPCRIIISTVLLVLGIHLVPPPSAVISSSASSICRSSRSSCSCSASFLPISTGCAPVSMIAYFTEMPPTVRYPFSATRTDAAQLIHSRGWRRGGFCYSSALALLLGPTSLPSSVRELRDLVLKRFLFQFSSPQPTPLPTSHSLSAPSSDKSVELSGPYLELVGYPIARATAAAVRRTGDSKARAAVAHEQSTGGGCRAVHRQTRLTGQWREGSRARGSGAPSSYPWDSSARGRDLGADTSGQRGAQGSGAREAAERAGQRGSRGSGAQGRNARGSGAQGSGAHWAVARMGQQHAGQ
ncbi:unnamed protein product [Closterium sp. NIES-54]